MTGNYYAVHVCVRAYVCVRASGGPFLEAPTGRHTLSLPVPGDKRKTPPLPSPPSLRGLVVRHLFALVSPPSPATLRRLGPIYPLKRAHVLNAAPSTPNSLSSSTPRKRRAVACECADLLETHTCRVWPLQRTPLTQTHIRLHAVRLSVAAKLPPLPPAQTPPLFFLLFLT